MHAKGQTRVLLWERGRGGVGVHRYIILICQFYWNKLRWIIYYYICLLKNKENVCRIKQIIIFKYEDLPLTDILNTYIIPIPPPPSTQSCCALGKRTKKAAGDVTGATRRENHISWIRTKRGRIQTEWSIFFQRQKEIKEKWQLKKKRWLFNCFNMKQLEIKMMQNSGRQAMSHDANLCL